MLKLFLASHGHMASGMKSSIEIFCGQNNHLTVFDAYVDERNVSEQLDAFYERCPKEVWPKLTELDGQEAVDMVQNLTK